MERDICIGGVEFSNPYRTWSYMKNLGNACMAGPGAAPCQCEAPVPCDMAPLFTIAVPVMGEGEDANVRAAFLTTADDTLTVTAVFSMTIGVYEVGDGGPCTAPATLPTDNDPDWDAGTIPPPFVINDAGALPLQYPTDTTPGAAVTCQLARYDMTRDGVVIGSLFTVFDHGSDTAGPLVYWRPASGLPVDWADTVDGPLEFGAHGAYAPCDEDADPAPLTVYTTPADDDAPWYDPADPRSADVLGVWLDDLTLSAPHHRTASDRQWGGSLSANKLGRRELTIGGRIYVRTTAAAAYARQWAYEVLMNSPCGEAGCRLPDVELRSFCDLDDPDGGLRYLHEVGLVDWAPVLDNTEPGHCWVSFTATLASKVPWLTKLPQTVHIGQVLQGVAFCDVCGNMTDAGVCAPRATVDPLALQCGCTDQPARAIATAQRSECYVRPMYVARHFIPVTNTKLWTDGALRFTIVGGTDGIASTVPSLKNLRIRAYPNPLGLGVDDANDLVCGSDPCADVAIGCVPYGATMVIDGSVRRSTVSVPGLSRSANPYLTSGGGKFTYPEYSCGDLMLAVDVDAIATTADSTIMVETIEVERG